MMDIRRIVLFTALGFVGYLLWGAWERDYPRPIQSAPTALSQEATSSSSNPMLPDMQAEEGGQAVNASAQAQADALSADASRIIDVKTDVLDLKIDLAQGDIVEALLTQYPESAHDKKTPFTLLQNSRNKRYVANSNLFVVQDKAVKTLDLHYEAAQTHYALAEGENTLEVVLKGQTEQGIQVTKRFVLTRGSYALQLDYDITNASAEPWTGYMNAQLLRRAPEEDNSSMFHVGSYTGASLSIPGKHRYQKVSFSQMLKSNFDAQSNGGWIAMQQHYFLSAWIPQANQKSRFYTRAQNSDFTVGFVSQPIVVQPAQKNTVQAKLYVGPEVANTLHALAPGLDLTVDYGMLWFLSTMLFSLMSTIYSFVGNWGFSIVLVTVLIKLAFYKLSATSYKSMANMRRLQPKLQSLRERYGDDKAKLSQATMEFYRQEKINPLGGCLPIVVQIPVFIALYWVLIESVALRQAPFVFWIHDLAAADPYHVLPVIMGITMLVQQRLNPAPPDPMQAKVMMVLPVFFTALFWGFPAGLVLYWIVNNTLSILQQWYITKKYSDVKPTKTKKLATAK